jgi:formamidopyrimidine-DNA glycosylase
LALPSDTDLALRSGNFNRGWGGPKMWSEGKKPGAQDKRLWFSRLLMILDDGTEVALTDPRRFGRMWLCDEDPSEHPRIKKLGFDPLIDFPSAKDLEPRLGKRRAPIKSILLDQSLFAGIGNWLADEILFQAKISPHHLGSALNPRQVKTLHNKILEVVKLAVRVGADYERFPQSWLFHHRWGKNKNAKTHAGKKIIHENIGGRTAAWVPSVQK